MSAGEKKGRLGEDAARLYLENKGFSFVAANLHVGHDEIDLLMRDGRTLVFVEVKLRTAGGGRFAVDAAKQRRISRAAVSYLQTHGGFEQPVRFDVVEIDYLGAEMEIRHLPDAFPLARGRYFV